MKLLKPLPIMFFAAMSSMTFAEDTYKQITIINGLEQTFDESKVVDPVTGLRPEYTTAYTINAENFDQFNSTFSPEGDNLKSLVLYNDYKLQTGYRVYTANWGATSTTGADNLTLNIASSGAADDPTGTYYCEGLGVNASLIIKAVEWNAEYIFNVNDNLNVYAPESSDSTVENPKYSGTAMYLGGGSVLNINSDSTVILYGDLYSSGTTTNAAHNAMNIAADAKLQVKGDATIALKSVINGELVVEGDATFNKAKGVTVISNNNLIDVAGNATFTATELNGSGNVNIGGDVTFNTESKLNLDNILVVNGNFAVNGTTNEKYKPTISSDVDAESASFSGISTIDGTINTDTVTFASGANLSGTGTVNVESDLTFDDTNKITIGNTLTTTGDAIFNTGASVAGEGAIIADGDATFTGTVNLGSDITAENITFNTASAEDKTLILTGGGVITAKNSLNFAEGALLTLGLGITSDNDMVFSENVIFADGAILSGAGSYSTLKSAKFATGTTKFDSNLTIAETASFEGNSVVMGDGTLTINGDYSQALQDAAYANAEAAATADGTKKAAELYDDSDIFTSLNGSNYADTNITGAAKVAYNGNLTVAGNLTVGDSATTAFEDIFQYRNSTITISDEGVLTVYGNIDASTYHKFSDNSEYDKNIKGNFIVENGGTINTSGDFTVRGSLNLSGEVNVGGTLILEKQLGYEPSFYKKASSKLIVNDGASFGTTDHIKIGNNDFTQGHGITILDNDAMSNAIVEMFNGKSNNSTNTIHLFVNFTDGISTPTGSVSMGSLQLNSYNTVHIDLFQKDSADDVILIEDILFGVTNSDGTVSNYSSSVESTKIVITDFQDELVKIGVDADKISITGDIMTIIDANNVSHNITLEGYYGAFNADTGLGFDAITNDFALKNGFLVVVPEPSTYAAIAGILALGLACYRRRK